MSKDAHPSSHVRSSTPSPNDFSRVPAFFADSRAFSFISSLAETAGISTPSRPVSPLPGQEEGGFNNFGSTPRGSDNEDSGGSRARQGNAGNKKRNSKAYPVGNNYLSNAKGKRGGALSPTHRRHSGQGQGGSPAHSSVPMATSRSAGSSRQASGESPKFSKKHIEQAIRLASEALDEDRKGRSGDAEYAVDCYFSSLDYLLAAVPPSTSVELLSAQPSRRAVLHNKLSKLVERLAAPPSPSAISANNFIEFPAGEHAANEVAAPAGGDKWWLVPVPARLRKRTASAPANKEQALAMTQNDGTVSGAIQPPTELMAACACGRKVTIRLPQWVLDSARAEAAMANGEQLPKTWAEALIAASVGIAVLIKQSPLPYLISYVFSSLIGVLFFLDERFNLRSNIIMFMGDALEAFVELDKALGLHQAAGEAASVVWEAGIRAAVAFARADGFRPTPSAANAAAWGPAKAAEMEPEVEGYNVGGSTSYAAQIPAPQPAQARARMFGGGRGMGAAAPQQGPPAGTLRRTASGTPSASSSTYQFGRKPRGSLSPPLGASNQLGVPPGSGRNSSGTSTPSHVSDQPGTPIQQVGSSSGTVGGKDLGIAGTPTSQGGTGLVEAPPSYAAVEEQEGGRRTTGWARSAAGSVAGRLGLHGGQQ